MDEPTELWPNQAEAAEALGVNAGTVTRWLQDLGVRTERDGGGSRVRPSLLLTLAEKHSAPVVAIAAMLLERANDTDSDDDAERMRDEVNDYLAAFKRRRDPNRKRTLTEVLEDLRAMLPPKIFAEVEQHFTASSSRPH